MTELTLKLKDSDYIRLEKMAKYKGKSVETLIFEWINQLPEEEFDITQDPVYQMEGYDSDAPSDLSINLDKYLYGDEKPL